MRRKPSQSTHENNRNFYINVCIQIYCTRTKELFYHHGKMNYTEDTLTYMKERGFGWVAWI